MIPPAVAAVLIGYPGLADYLAEDPDAAVRAWSLELRRAAQRAFLSDLGQPLPARPTAAEAELVTATEAARVLGVSPRTVTRRAERGELAAYRPGHEWLIDLEHSPTGHGTAGESAQAGPLAGRGVQTGPATVAAGPVTPAPDRQD